MEFYDEKDMNYWRKQAEEGNAVIIDIPVEMLLELDINEIRMPSKKNVKPEEIQAWLDTHREEFEKNWMSLDPDCKDKDLLALVTYISADQREEKVMENQSVIRQPIVRNGRQATVGYAPEVWKNWQ